MYDYELEEERMKLADEEREYRRYISQLHCKGCDCVIDDEDNLTEGLCDDCVDKLLSFDNAMEIGEYEKTEIELNSFLCSQFDESQIEEILTRELKNSRKSDKYKAEAKRFYDLDSSNYLNTAIKLDII